MIDLSPEQRPAIAHGEALRIVDPLTHDAYVLVRADEFERLVGEAPRLLREPNPEIPSMLLRSMQAFWRDLPGLLAVRRNRNKWAAYRGNERVAIARSQGDAYQVCFRRGFKDEEIYVGKLEADPDGVPPWGTIVSDRSFYEYTAPDDPPADEA